MPLPLVAALAVLLLFVSGCSDGGAPRPDEQPDPAPPADPPEVVVTSNGKVRGDASHEGMLAFRGIPYAAPPVGELRFRPPEPAVAWDGVRDALAFGDACVQPEEALGASDALLGSEDCLTLNVWTPSPRPESPLPVLFYIHGGYYVVGSSADELDGTHLYDGAWLAAHGPAVVVTINYRLGAFGFLAHESLSAESKHGGSGNWAFLDQLQALAWVQDNIARFGGDPARVMVFGNSAGGGSAAALMASPRSEGSFATAILESSGGATLSLAAAEDQGAAFASAAGCDEAATAAGCLRAKPPAAIAAADATVAASWGPSVDGLVLPDTIYRLLEGGQHARRPVIVGSTAEEFSTLIYQFEPTPVASEADYQSRVLAMFGETFAAEVLAMYPSADYASPHDALVAIYTDLVYGCPARRLTRALADHDPGRTYRYVYTHRFAKGALAPFGAGHPFDNMLVFHNLPETLFELEPEELELADALARSWASFAADADPNGGEDGPWRAYSLATDNHLDVSLTPGQAAGYRAAQCDFWEPYL